MGDAAPTPAAGAAIDRDRLVAYLDAYLDAGASRDYAPNGLQVEGRPTIGKIVTGVSACQELFERAAAAGADAVLVHHGLFWRGASLRLTGVAWRRVKALLAADLNLIAYHLPLDRHPEVGNNAVAARRLGLVELAPFGLHEGLPVGFSGRFAEPLPAPELVARCRRLYAQEPLVLGRGPRRLTAVGIVSGSAPRDLHTALEAGLDAFLTGEATEWVTNLAREAGIHYLACGHYATERLGVQALGEHLAERFGVAVEFIDVPNPV
jgi:dinuclear metal center YbgI/SA1388 family protein